MDIRLNRIVAAFLNEDNTLNVPLALRACNELSPNDVQAAAQLAFEHLVNQEIIKRGISGIDAQRDEVREGIAADVKDMQPRFMASGRGRQAN